MVGISHFVTSQTYPDIRLVVLKLGFCGSQFLTMIFLARETGGIRKIPGAGYMSIASDTDRFRKATKKAASILPRDEYCL